MKKQHHLILLMGFIVHCTLYIAKAQSFQQFYPEFIVEGQILSLASVGGLSSPQYSEVDLNKDGIQDLYIYDKIGQVSLTFINGGTPNVVDYHYAPEYLANFPDLYEWVLLRDYNGDDIQDIFAYSSTPGVAGMEVHTGYYNDKDQIAFRPAQLTGGAFNIIYYPGSNGANNLYVSNVDYPAVDDIDGDGDLDIITFNIGGGIVDLYTNQSVERGFGLDSLQYVLEDDCWGRFYESGINLEIDLSANQDNCAGRLRTNENSDARSGLHAGSTVTTLDMDNDGDKEVLLGDISFTNLNLVTNGGSRELAFMNAQDITFPRNTTPVNIPIFPASFILDINNDGLRDLVAAPNLGNDIGETYNVGWYYANINTNENPVFDYRYKDLLVGEMLDFGTGAYPVFVDYNADGLQDLVIGNKSFFVPGGDKNARLYLFENTGTRTNPKYELKNDNYLGLNSFSNSSWRFAPTFGDLDGDGDLDALIGEEFGNLFYAENLAGPNQAFNFAPVEFGYQTLDVGQVSKPQILDVNKDGLVDLVIGERNGNLNYFENTGTPENPVFDRTPTNKNFGLVDTRDEGYVTGYSAPVLVPVEESLHLLAGSQSGTIKRYTNIANNLIGEFTKTADNYGNLKVGEETHFNFADIDGDGLLEMVIGNIRGGINFYQTDLASPTMSTPTKEVVASVAVSVYPNPTTGILHLSLPPNQEATTLKIYNSLGELVHAQAYATTINLTTLAAGAYTLSILSPKKLFIEKFIKNH